MKISTTHIVVAGGLVVGGYLAWKHDAIGRLRNLFSSVSGGRAAPDTAKGVDAGTGVVSDDGPTSDQGGALDYVPSLDVSSKDTGGPAAPLPQVYTRAQWFLTNAPRLNS